MKGTSSSKVRDTGSITFSLCLQCKPNLYNWSREGFSGSCRVTRELKHSDIGKSNRNMWLQTSGCLVNLWPFSDLMFTDLLGALQRNDLIAAHHCPGKGSVSSLQFIFLRNISYSSVFWRMSFKWQKKTPTNSNNKNKQKQSPNKTPTKVGSQSSQAEISR